MKFHCKRDKEMRTYELSGEDSLEDLFVLIAADFNLPLEQLAIRHGTRSSWNSDRCDRRLSEFITAVVSSNAPVPTALDVQVMSREAAATVDAAAARITGLFSGSSSLTSPPSLTPHPPPAFSSRSSNGTGPQPVVRLEDEEIQRRLYQEIQQRNIDENLKTAIEYTPEVFAPVTMLYVNCVINGVKLQAFVDTGAQMSIMNVKTAERCGLSRLVDPRMKGVAIGVGKQAIIGRIHLVTVQLETVHIPFAFSVLKEQPMDIIIGLDQLRRHQFLIDLKENCMRFENISIPFLPECELPDFAKLLGQRSKGASPEVTATEVVEKESKSNNNNNNHSNNNQHKRGASRSPSRLSPSSSTQSPLLRHRSSPPRPGLPQLHSSPTPPMTPLPSSAGYQRASSDIWSAGVSGRTSPKETNAERHRRLVNKLKDFIGAVSDSEATALLEVSDWDVEAAAALFFEQGEVM